MVEDRSGSTRQVEPLSGDRVALWIRWIHEGSHSGTIWQVLVFLCGVLPTLFDGHRDYDLAAQPQGEAGVGALKSQACRRSTPRSNDNDHWPRPA